MTATHRPALDHATRVALEERIVTLVGWRKWYRSKRPGWSDLRAENKLILRELFAIRRAAKRSIAGESQTLAFGDHFKYPEPEFAGSGRGSGGEF